MRPSINSMHFSLSFFSFVGGFAFVYVVEDTQTGTEYALKRLLGSDKQACNNIIRELNIHKQLSGHPNIVKYVAASFIDRTAAKGNAEYLLVSELCKGKMQQSSLVLISGQIRELMKSAIVSIFAGGSLIDCLGSTIEPEIVLKIFYQATKAVGHMHAQSPPIVHRDIKVGTVHSCVPASSYEIVVSLFRLRISYSVSMVR